ncbi:MAG: 4Fe-4S dicluster domain-containing protein [Firmicutes bacterium]|nr:4Fe-4S dicluster domain-containing protein [Bacillota bacterium]
MRIKGRVDVEPELCKGCGLCVAFCPRKVLALADEVNSKGYRIVAQVKPEECNGCTICAQMCPDIALTVWRSGRSKEAV